jgi:cytochrome oxidase Cu insertion factor (SCO1/SenC/PrrC family)
VKKIIAIAAGLLLLAGCGNTNHYKVKLAAPKTFTPGNPYPMQVNVTDNDGKPLKGAKVSMELNMKNMDHGTLPVSVEETGSGKYIGLADISMGGDWLADIKVEQSGKTYEIEKPFTVAAKTMENAHKVTKNVSLPDFKLMDENGKTVTKQELLGKTVVMTFTYVNCVDPNACPILLGNFSNLQQDLNQQEIDTSNIMLVSVSVDPEHDTPANLKEHAAKMNFDLSYLKMLTGDMSEIRKVANTLGEKFSKQRAEVMHDNKTFVFDHDGKLTHEFDGSYVDREELFQVVTNAR